MFSLPQGSFSKNIYELYSQGKTYFESCWNPPSLKKFEGPLSFSLMEKNLDERGGLHRGEQATIEELVSRLSSQFLALEKDQEQLQIGTSSCSPKLLKKAVETACLLFEKFQNKGPDDPYFQASLLNTFNKIQGYFSTLHEHLESEIGESKHQLKLLVDMKKKGYKDPTILNFLALEGAHLRELVKKSEDFQEPLAKLFKAISSYSLGNSKSNKHWEKLQSKLIRPDSSYEVLNQKQSQALLEESSKDHSREFFRRA